VKTKLVQQDFKVPFFSITPEDCAASAIKTVGIETFTYGHWRHKLLAYITGSVASIMNQRTLMRSTLSRLKPVRDEYYRRNNLTDNF
jgi:hypothetical protein